MDDKDLFSFSESNDEPEKQSYDTNSNSDGVVEDSHDISSSSEESAPESLDLNSFSAASADKTRKGKKNNKSGWQRFLKVSLTVMLIGIITVSIVCGSFLLYAFTMVDGTMDVDLHNPDELFYTTTIYVKDKTNDDWVEYQRLHGEFNRIWVPYNEIEAKKEDNADYTGIPQLLADAFVAIEDKRFHTHYGVDWKRTFGAVINTFIPIYSSQQGGSTITQQLVKNLTNDREDAASRKVREIMRARYLENEYSKSTILECYMNTIPMGHGIYGVEVAANYYFGKSVKDLTLLECASLASITKAPSNYAPDDNPERNKERRETVLAFMLEQGYITKEEHDAALKEELNLVASREELNETEVNNYFVDALIVDVTNDLADKYGWDDADAAENFYNGGYKIYATLDPEIQSAVDEVFSNAEAYGLKAKDGSQLQGAITVMDYNGRVKGLAGGIGEKTVNLGLSGFNRATDAIRQPGSTMKPLAAYTPAIEEGRIHYSSILNDTATKYKNWTPKNWYNSYWGGVTTQYALERSINTIPVYLVNEMGPQNSYDFLTQKLGITTLNKNDIDLSPLGMGGTNGGITTVESAAAYAIYGNGGKYYEPTLYYAVYDQQNNVVLSHEKSKPQTAISEDTATVMNKMLQKVVYGSNGTGKAAAGYIKDMKIYAKTGTSNNANDLWFVGGTPYYVASCWCGYDNPQSISDSAIALKMWGNVMSKVHSGLEKREFKESTYALERYYCTETGRLATDACPSKAVGWYKKGKKYMPALCDKHEGTALDSPKVEAEKAKQETEKAENAANPDNAGNTTSSTPSTTG